MAHNILRPYAPLESVDVSSSDWTPQKRHNHVRAIFVGTGGDVKLTTKGVDGTEDTVTFKNWATGTMMRLRAIKIFSTGTTATDIVAMY